MKKSLYLLLFTLGFGLGGIRGNAQPLSAEAVDGVVRRLMDTAHVTGLCVGIIRHGKAIGFSCNGKNIYSVANAAGSMETTIADFTRFLAAVMRGEGLSRKAWTEMTSIQIKIHSAHQFPSLDKARTKHNNKIALGYGLGWGICTGQKGKMFFKEGHDDGWEHFGLCMPDANEAVVVMTNSSNGERIFKEIFEKLAGVEIPWKWERYTPY